MLRKSLSLALVVVAVLALLAGPPGGPAQAQGDPAAQTISNLNLRSGPGQDFPVLATLPRGTRVIIEGRNNVGNWVLVHATDGWMRGWVASRYLLWPDGLSLAALPVTSTTVSAPNTSAQVVDPGKDAGPGNARTVSLATLRAGPGTGYPSLVSVPAETPLLLAARSPDDAWVLAQTADGQWRGWVATGHLDPAADRSALPEASYVLEGADINDILIARLNATPVLPVITPRAVEIFAEGQAQGLHRNVFSKVGDCHTDHPGFFLPFGVGEYDLGSYQALQATLDYFGVSPRPGVANSFVNESMAASSAFTAAAVLDPVWADPSNCQPGESPLACEYRLVRPAVAIILLGAVDMQIYRVEDFAYYMRQVLTETISRGVLPVLTTFPSSPNYLWEQSLLFNAMILDLAAEAQVPVINFWLASRPLPNYGLEQDNFHLSHPDARFISFNGDEGQWGITRRNLVTLQALDELRRTLLGG